MKFQFLFTTRLGPHEPVDLGKHPGPIHADGVQALIDLIRSSREPLTVIGIAPTPNLGEALRRAPDIAARTNFVGMHGSIRTAHDGKPGAIAEWNVACDIPSSQAVFAAPWKSMVITPLDTCGRVRLRGDKYQKIAKSAHPLAKATIDSYRIWLQGQKDEMSSILYDTVAVHLAFSREFLKTESMPVLVTDDGFTRVDPKGRRMEVAIDWTDLPGYEDYLADRMLAPVTKR